MRTYDLLCKSCLILVLVDFSTHYITHQLLRDLEAHRTEAWPLGTPRVHIQETRWVGEDMRAAKLDKYSLQTRN